MVDDFILDPVPGGTIVRLLGSGFPAGRRVGHPVLAAAHQLAAAMTRLKVFVEKLSRPGAPA